MTNKVNKFFCSLSKTLVDGMMALILALFLIICLVWMIGGAFVHFVGVTGSFFIGSEKIFIAEIDGLGSTALYWEKVLFGAECVTWVIIVFALIFTSVKKNYNSD